MREQALHLSGSRAFSSRCKGPEVMCLVILKNNKRIESWSRVKERVVDKEVREMLEPDSGGSMPELSVWCRVTGCLMGLPFRTLLVEELLVVRENTDLF